MTIQDWLGLTLTSLTILTIIGVAVRWILRHYLKDIVHELKPNGGSSIKDQVNRLEKNLSNLENQRKDSDILNKEAHKKIDHIYEVLLDYIAKSSK